MQTAYRGYLARMRASGLPAQDFPSYTADYIYTRGFSADGIRHAQAANAGMQAREHAAWQGVQQAQGAMCQEVEKAGHGSCERGGRGKGGRDKARSSQKLTGYSGFCAVTSLATLPASPS